MRPITILLAVLLIIIQYPLWLGKGGWLRVWELHRQLEAVQARNEEQRLKNAKIAAEKALQSVISQESWKQYLALDEICNELECARYKAMYLAGAADYEKISK
mgnify:CR=1 FL=1